MHKFDRVGVDVGSDFMKSTVHKFIISTWLFAAFVPNLVRVRGVEREGP